MFFFFKGSTVSANALFIINNNCTQTFFIKTKMYGIHLFIVKIILFK